MSTAAYLYSGQVWTERWDSAMTTTPEIPNGLNSWNRTPNLLAWARFGASTSAPFTFSRLLMASESQSNNSSSRCRPRAFNLLTLLYPVRPSTAPLLRRVTRRCSLHLRAEKILRRDQTLFDCRVRFHPLQEKSAARRRFCRRRDRRRAGRTPGAEPLHDRLRPPRASLSPVSRRSPTAVGGRAAL